MNFLRTLLKDNNIIINEDKLSLLKKYREYIKDNNNNFNIVGNCTDKFIEEELFFDSIISSRLINENIEYSNCIDLGSGAGIPGIIMSILNNKKSFTLVDSTQKKCDFLNSMKESLNLNNIEIICSRAEDLDTIEKYDLVVSKAMANLGTLLELSSSILKINGKTAFLKGIKVEDELNMYTSKKIDLSFSKSKIIPYQYDHKKRFLVIFEKIKKTNKKFPRNYKIIKNFYQN